MIITDKLPVVAGKFEVSAIPWPDLNYKAAYHEGRIKVNVTDAALENRALHLLIYPSERVTTIPTPSEGQEFIVVTEGSLYHVHYYEPAQETEPITDSDVPEEVAVFMMASGYEWECPECGHEHRAINAAEKVRCGDCGRVFWAYIQ